ncbi:MAG: YbaB/EbfC family nucleoid-associated protein [Microthrixaceae bacterium]
MADSEDSELPERVIPAELVDGPRSGEPGDPGDPLAALPGGGGLDLGAMMEMAQNMTEQMGAAQSELAEARIEGTAGGGLVKVVLNGHLHLLEVEIQPGAFDPDDPSMVGDLVLAAWRDAHDEVAKLQAAADPLGGLGGGLGGLGGDLGDLLGGG